MYSLLKGVRAIEIALLAPDLLGMHLADLGAEVIKIEQPPAGDYLREIGAHKLRGMSLMHLRWNRGKRSIQLDLKRTEGQTILHKLVEQSDVFINGLRAGAAERLRADYETIRTIRPSIVYCSLSGTGQFGPYARLPTHGVAYDAFAGLAPPAHDATGNPRIPARYIPVGMYAAPLYGAMAVCAALVRASRTGQGSNLEVAELDVSASWHAEHIDAALNGADANAPEMESSVRYQYYRTADDRTVVFQASERKFWRNFCAAVGRLDLFEKKPGAPAGDHARGDEALRQELCTIFRSRTAAQWVRFFIEHDIPGGHVYEPAEIPNDEHFKSRQLLFEQNHPRLGSVRMFSTPVKVSGETFSARPAPSLGQDTADVLHSVLDFSDEEIQTLQANGVI
jgi:crotonobetainyl-CoA:carnitine CoA-transferase CaiB-like acyl-CoA transferase